VILGEKPEGSGGPLIYGAFGYGEAIGYTLFYATNFIFTGLAVALAFQCGLFNIGGEGQAYIGGLGVGLAGIYGSATGPWPIGIMIGIMAAALFGGIWGFIPGWLQARRGSHTVITTIMLNFIAASIMTYLLVNPLIKPGPADPGKRHLRPQYLAAAAARAASAGSASRSAARPSTSRSSSRSRCCCASTGSSSGRRAPATRCGWSATASPRRSMPASRRPSRS
jgi:general nucleoside transport system permease protein